MIKKNIAVLCGGWSEERLISLKSGDSVYKCLKENGYEVTKIDVKTANEAFNEELYSKFDLVFILLHGRGGEDGDIQKFFEENDIAFTGSNSQSSRITMNKIKAIKKKPSSLQQQCLQRTTRQRHPPKTLLWMLPLLPRTIRQRMGKA